MTTGANKWHVGALHCIYRAADAKDATARTRQQRSISQAVPPTLPPLRLPNHPPASWRYCGICVVLPLPVSPTTMVVVYCSTRYRISSRCACTGSSRRCSARDRASCLLLMGRGMHATIKNQGSRHRLLHTGTHTNDCNGTPSKPGSLASRLRLHIRIVPGCRRLRLGAPVHAIRQPKPRRLGRLGAAIARHLSTMERRWRWCRGRSRAGRVSLAGVPLATSERDAAHGWECSKYDRCPRSALHPGKKLCHVS